MRRGPALAAAACATLAMALTGPALAADRFRLRNGGTILADSWEERGETIVIHQGSSTLVIPKGDVLRVEKGATAATDPRAGGTIPRAAPPDLALPPAGDNLTPEEIERLIDRIKRRINDYPLARTENSRQLVALLCRLGAEAYRKRDYDAAQQRFREAQEYDPHDAQASLGMAATYAAQGQDLYARSVLERAILDHAEDPSLLALLGQVYDSEERPEDALAAWQKSLALRPDESIRRKVDKLQREHAIDGAYRLSEAAHFTLKYDGEKTGPDLGSQVVEALEAEYPALETRFGFVPSQPIVVIVYPQRQFYEATLAESNVGGLFDGKIRVPLGGLQHLNEQARKVLVHELTHAFVTGKTHGTAPRWLQEGLAQQSEGKTTPTSTGIPLAKRYKALEDKSSWGTDFSYPSALSFVEFLIDHEGYPRLVDVLQSMGEGAPLDAAFERATHYTLTELRQAWGEALVAKYLQ